MVFQTPENTGDGGEIDHPGDLVGGEDVGEEGLVTDVPGVISEERVVGIQAGIG